MKIVILIMIIVVLLIVVLHGRLHTAAVYFPFTLRCREYAKRGIIIRFVFVHVAMSYKEKGEREKKRI